MMMPQSTPWPKVGLPGRPVIEEGGVMVDVSFTRIIRIRGGRVLYFTDAFDAERVAATASKFLGRDFRQVFFLRKNGDRQPHFALAAPTGKPLTKADALFVLAAALWWTRKVGGVKRKKARLMFA